MPLPTQNSPPSFCHHPLARRKLLIPPGSAHSKICSPPTAEKDGGNYDLLYQNSVRKYEDDLEHQVFYILCNLQFFQI